MTAVLLIGAPLAFPCALGFANTQIVIAKFYLKILFGKYTVWQHKKISLAVSPNGVNVYYCSMQIYFVYPLLANGVYLVYCKELLNCCKWATIILTN